MQVAQRLVHLQGLGLVDDLSRGFARFPEDGACGPFMEPPGSLDQGSCLEGPRLRSLQLEALRRPRPHLIHSWKLLPVLDLIQRLGLGERGVRHLVAVVVETTKQTNAQTGQVEEDRSRQIADGGQRTARSKQDEVHVATCSGIAFLNLTDARCRVLTTRLS